MRAVKSQVYLFRSTVTNNFKGPKLYTSYKLIWDSIHPITVDILIQYDKRTRATMLKAGKIKVVNRNRKYDDRTQYPIHLSLAEYQLKIYAYLNKEGDQFLINVNSVPYLRLPYMFEITEDQDSEIVDATVVINDEYVTIP